MNANLKYPAGLLSFALRQERILDLGPDYLDIIEFIEKEKLKEVEKERSVDEIINENYDKYIDEEINSFKETAEYHFISYEILKSYDERIDNIIAINNENNVNNDKYIDFKENRENSKLFKEAIIKEIKLIKGLMNKEEFKIKYLKDK